MHRLASRRLILYRKSRFPIRTCFLYFDRLEALEAIPHAVVFVSLTGWKPIPHVVVVIALTGWKPLTCLGLEPWSFSDCSAGLAK